MRDLCFYRPYYTAFFFFQGRELIGNDVKGALCIRTSIPSMSRTVYGHHQRYLDTYYNPFKGVGSSCKID